MKTFVLMLVLALVPLAFAQSSACEQNCCTSSGGSWDPSYESCSGAGNSYYSCVNSCNSASGGSPSCCDSIIFIMAVLGGTIYLKTRN